MTLHRATLHVALAAARSLYAGLNEQELACPQLRPLRERALSLCELVEESQDAYDSLIDQLLGKIHQQHFAQRDAFRAIVAFADDMRYTPKFRKP